MHERIIATMRRAIKKYGWKCDIYKPVDTYNALGEKSTAYELVYKEVPIVYRVRRVTMPRASSSGIYAEEFLEASIIPPDDLRAPFEIQPGYEVLLNQQRYKILTVTRLALDWWRITLGREG